VSNSVRMLDLVLVSRSAQQLAAVLEFSLVVSLVHLLEIDWMVVKLACWWLVE